MIIHYEFIANLIRLVIFFYFKFVYNFKIRTKMGSALEISFKDVGITCGNFGGTITYIKGQMRRQRNARYNL